MTATHWIERTSPKGPGQEFIGRCPMCGQEGLKEADALKPCPAARTKTQDEVIVAAIMGEDIIK